MQETATKQEMTTSDLAAIFQNILVPFGSIRIESLPGRSFEAMARLPGLNLPDTGRPAAVPPG
jgi:hypothetical protein